MKKLILSILIVATIATVASASLELGNAKYSPSGNYIDVIVHYTNETGRDLSYVEIKCTALNKGVPVGQAMLNKLSVPPGYSEWMKGSIRVNDQIVEDYECQVTEER